MFNSIESDYQIDIAQHEKFCLSFLMRYESRIDAKFGAWWPSASPFIARWATTQREFDGIAWGCVNSWIEKLGIARLIAAQSKEEPPVTETPETPETPEQQVKRLRDVWGVTKLGRWSDEEISQIRKSIFYGTKKSVPARLRRRTKTWDALLGKYAYQETQIQDDSNQDAWVRLLAGTFNPQLATIAGLNAGRDETRKILKLVPISQTATLGDDGEPNDDDERDPLLPWDKVGNGGVESYQREVAHQIVSNQQDDHRRTILYQFKIERPEDHAFIVEFFSRVGTDVRFRRGHMGHISRRGESACMTGAERKRAHDIISRLQRLEALEKYS